MESDKTTYRIIATYESNRLLWDPKNDDYHNKIKKNAIRVQLASDLECSGKFLNNNIIK